MTAPGRVVVPWLLSLATCSAATTGGDPSGATSGGSATSRGSSSSGAGVMSASGGTSGSAGGGEMPPPCPEPTCAEGTLGCACAPGAACHEGACSGGTCVRVEDGHAYVPAGTYCMGCDPERDAACVTDELPAHAVELSAFDLDLTEVTQQQYAACVDAAACPVPDDTQTCYAKWDPVVLAEHPVVCVDHAAATAYCAWVGRALPTEAQWEAAARGPAAWLYPWGDVAPACELANYGPSAMDCVGATTPVGAYPSGASPFGALDLAGNVWEWTADWYGPSSYREGPFVDPVGAASGSARVLRGGGFTSPEAFLRATARDGARAPWKTARNVGFRCASSTGHP